MADIFDIPQPVNPQCSAQTPASPTLPGRVGPPPFHFLPVEMALHIFHLSMRITEDSLRIYYHHLLSTIIYWKSKKDPNHQFDQVAKIRCFSMVLPFFIDFQYHSVPSASSRHPTILRPHDVWPPPWAEPPHSADAAAPGNECTFDVKLTSKWYQSSNRFQMNVKYKHGLSYIYITIN